MRRTRTVVRFLGDEKVGSGETKQYRSQSKQHIYMLGVFLSHYRWGSEEFVQGTQPVQMFTPRKVQHTSRYPTPGPAIPRSPFMQGILLYIACWLEGSGVCSKGVLEKPQILIQW